MPCLGIMHDGLGLNYLFNVAFNWYIIVEDAFIKAPSSSTWEVFSFRQLLSQIYINSKQYRKFLIFFKKVQILLIL